MKNHKTEMKIYDFFSEKSEKQDFSIIKQKVSNQFFNLKLNMSNSAYKKR